MNLLGHLHVARAVDPHPEVLLGAVLPDLEPLLGVRLVGGGDRVARGRALHHATDAAFHGDARFRAGSVALTRDLLARGVDRGAARGVGHAGWELLLDGLLLEEDGVVEGFAAAAAALEELADGDGDPSGRLRRFARRQATEPLWRGYEAPAEIVARLHRQLARRPRLALPDHQVPAAVDALTAARPAVAAVAPALLADVTTVVST